MPFVALQIPLILATREIGNLLLRPLVIFMSKVGNAVFDKLESHFYSLKGHLDQR